MCSEFSYEGQCRLQSRICLQDYWGLSASTNRLGGCGIRFFATWEVHSHIPKEPDVPIFRAGSTNFLILKMGARNSPKSFVFNYQTSECHIPQTRNPNEIQSPKNITGPDIINLHSHSPNWKVKHSKDELSYFECLNIQSGECECKLYYTPYFSDISLCTQNILPIRSNSNYHVS